MYVDLHVKGLLFLSNLNQQENVHQKSVGERRVIPRGWMDRQTNKHISQTNSHFSQLLCGQT